MNALILLSHGSRRSESNAEMQSLASQIRALPQNSFIHVACAFQQFAAPSIEQTFEDLVAKGVTHFVVFPLFLAAGSHVLEDVPEIMQKLQARYPDVHITVKPHLGRTDGLAGFLLDRSAGTC